MYSTAKLKSSKLSTVCMYVWGDTVPYPPILMTTDVSGYIVEREDLFMIMSLSFPPPFPIQTHTPL